jgi:hypothetical protein
MPKENQKPEKTTVLPSHSLDPRRKRPTVEDTREHKSNIYWENQPSWYRKCD